MKAFVTGGTGFIGQRVVQLLIDRGYEVTCLTRHPEDATDLRALGATVVEGDIADPDSMRQSMAGSDVVFHMAGWYEIGLPPSAAKRMQKINVEGTKNVLGLAVELDIPKIVYTSTAFVLGDTHGKVVDETYQRDSPFLSAYDETKSKAHQVAERLIDQGAPIIIVMPAAVYGPGDHSMLATFLRLLLRRMLPVMPAADTGFSLVHVDDVARGHVLAAEEGRIGESYILGGEIMTAGDAFQVVARMAGVPAPLLLLDSGVLTPLRPIANWLEKLVSLPALLSSESLSTLGSTWLAESNKAERELGYTYRSLEEGMAETITWEAAQLHQQATLIPLHYQAAALAATLAALLILGIRFLRRRDHSAG